MGRLKAVPRTATPIKRDIERGVPKPQLFKEKLRNGQSSSHSPVRNRVPDATMASEPTLAVKAAAKDARHAFEDPSSSSLLSSHAKTKEQLRKYHLKTLHKVIDESDIIILVLDARDPKGCRSRIIEEEVRRREVEGKRLVFVLNKIDLVSKTNAQAWLKYLRHSAPTLPFLSPPALQHQRSNISSSIAPTLRDFLKAYKPKAGSATVGVVGYPNVGKSSLINSLKRMEVCAVAAQPGHTRELQSVQLERGLRIIDSPGAAFDNDDGYEGWNRQNIPYYSEPPTIHPSLITSTAPSANNVGQVQIASQFSRSFRLGRLLDAADAAAFGNEMPTHADDDEDVFFDAEEGPMEVDASGGTEMNIQAQSPRTPSKLGLSSTEINLSRKPGIRVFLNMIG